MPETLALSLHITRRNWAVYRKDFIANISPTIADPAFIILALGLGLGGFVSSLEGRSYLQFIAPGITISTALFTAFFETSYGFYVRLTYENVFKAMLATPIGVNEIVIGEFIWVSLKGAVMAFCVGIVLALFGLMQDWTLIPLLAIVGFLVALPCGAIGLLASAFVRNINQFQTIYSFLISPLFFLSGIFFPISQMPIYLKIFNAFFPLYHGVLISQSIFWNENITQAFAIHGSALIAQSILFCWFAHRQIKKKLQN